KDLPIADAPGFGALFDSVDHRVRDVVGHHDLQLDLGYEVDHVRGATVDFFLATSAAEPLDFGHGHALDTDLGQGIFDLVQLKRLDDRLDLFHLALLKRVWGQMCPVADHPS